MFDIDEYESINIDNYSEGDIIFFRTQPISSIFVHCRINNGIKSYVFVIECAFICNTFYGVNKIYQFFH